MNIASKPTKMFKDAKGRTVLTQRPNLPVIGWLGFTLLAMFTHNAQLADGFCSLGNAFLFTWAFLELTKGVNYFRRLLGLIVISAMVAGFFSLP